MKCLIVTDALHQFYYIIPFLKPIPIFKGLAKIKNLRSTLPKIDIGYNHNSFGNIISSRKVRKVLSELFMYVCMCVRVHVTSFTSSLGIEAFPLVRNST